MAGICTPVRFRSLNMKARKTASLVGSYQSSRERVVATVNVSSVETLTISTQVYPVTE